MWNNGRESDKSKTLSGDLSILLIVGKEIARKSVRISKLINSVDHWLNWCLKAYSPRKYTLFQLHKDIHQEGPYFEPQYNERGRHKLPVSGIKANTWP